MARHLFQKVSQRQSLRMEEPDEYVYCHSGHGIRANMDDQGIFMWTSIIIVIFIVVCIAISFAFTKCDRNCASMFRLVSVGLGICIWLLFFCNYASQINPLITPSIAGEKLESDICSKNPKDNWYE